MARTYPRTKLLQNFLFTVALLYVQRKCGRVEFEEVVQWEGGEGEGERHTRHTIGHTQDLHSQQKPALGEAQHCHQQQLAGHGAVCRRRENHRYCSYIYPFLIGYAGNILMSSRCTYFFLNMYSRKEACS